MKNHIIKILAAVIMVFFIGISISPGIISYIGIKINDVQINKSGTTSLSTDWWTMYHHDINLTGYSTSTAPTTNKVLWVNDPFEDPMYDGFWYDPQRSSPAIVNDNIYIGVVDPRYSKNTTSSHEFDLQKDSLPLKNPFKYNRNPNERSPSDRWYEAYLICINAQTGFEKWITRLDDEYMIKGSPAVAEGRVYITTTDNFFGSYGHLFCLDAYTGSILWNFTLNGYESFSPTVENGKVYASGWIETEDSSRICKLFCLNAETGIEVFNTTLGVGEPVDAISVYNNLVYVSILDYSLDTFLYCVDTLNGDISWSKNLPGNFLISSAVVSNGKIYVTSSYYDFQANYSCYIDCFDSITGDSYWNRNFDCGANCWSTPAIAYDRIYMTISNVSYTYDISYNEKGWLYCLDINNGEIIWDKLLTQDAVIYSSPAIADGKIYVNSMSYGSIHGYMYCLDAITGDDIWQYWLAFPIYSSPAIAGGRLYLASWDYFYAFDDSAPSDNPPVATFTGPKYGIT